MGSEGVLTALRRSWQEPDPRNRRRGSADRVLRAAVPNVPGNRQRAEPPTEPWARVITMSFLRSTGNPHAQEAFQAAQPETRSFRPETGRQPLHLPSRPVRPCWTARLVRVTGGSTRTSLVSLMVCLPPRPVTSACTASPGHTACPGEGIGASRLGQASLGHDAARTTRRWRLQLEETLLGPSLASRPRLPAADRRTGVCCSPARALVSAAEGTEAPAGWAAGGILRALGTAAGSGPGYGEFWGGPSLGGAGGRRSLCGGLEACLQDTARRTPSPAGQSRLGRQHSAVCAKAPLCGLTLFALSVGADGVGDLPLS